jgi:hypothetical protein
MATDNQATCQIESLTEQAARELLEAEPTLKAASPTETDAAIGLALRAEQGSATRLAAAFREDESFGNLRKGWIQQRGGAGIPVQAHAVPRLLISSALQGHPVKSITDEAWAFAASQTSITESYTALTGVALEGPISLCKNVDLIPWEGVPESRHKALFSSELPLPHIRTMPNAAVRACSVEGQVLFSSNKEVGPRNKDLEVSTVQLDDILRCITVLTVAPVGLLGGWTQFRSKIAEALGVGSYWYSQAFYTADLWRVASKPVTLNGEDVARVFSLFQHFKPAEKQVLQVALDRLIQALRRKHRVDKAIDLGIALEVMLLHGIGKDDRGEMRFRSSIRGATFLGGDREERLEVLRLLKEAYDLRSQAVHSGVLKKGKSEPTLEQAARICAKIALKLIERRSFPDWDADIVIGG